jgi:hypothetical protein
MGNDQQCDSRWIDATQIEIAKLIERLDPNAHYRWHHYPAQGADCPERFDLLIVLGKGEVGERFNFNFSRAEVTQRTAVKVVEESYRRRFEGSPA